MLVVIAAEGAIAQNQSRQQIDFSNIEQLTFSDLDPVKSGGQISDRWNGKADYQVGRTWQKGDRIEDILRLGDLASGGGFAPQNLSLDDISTGTGRNIAENTSLSEFSLLSDKPLSQLCDIPTLNGEKIEDIEPVSRLLQQESQFVENLPSDPDNLTFGQLVEEFPAAGDLQLSELGKVLEGYSINDLPGASSTKLGNIEGWADSSPSSIPGLDELPFGNFSNISANVGTIARIDAIWGSAEDHRTDTISGSKQAGFSVACSEEGKLVKPDDAATDPAKCAYIELDDTESEGNPPASKFEGKQWISGKYHEVEGGFGVLKNVPSPFGYSTGYEPTGRHPFGEGFKVVVWEPDESEGKVNFKLWFRWCALIAGMRTCTPYNQLRVPWLSRSTNDKIFIGKLDGEGGATATSGISDSAIPVGNQNPSFGVPGQSPSTAPCGEMLNGINVGRLGEAIHQIESQGSGEYTAIGVHTCTPYNCGRGLGKHQMMSYLPEVQKRVKQKPGGAQWLQRLKNGSRPTKSELQKYFPSQVQEAAYREEMKQLMQGARQEIDPTTGKAFSGGRLVERVAQKWFGGAGAPIDGGASDALGRLSLYEYGKQARQNYQAMGGSQPTSNSCAQANAPEGSGKATGTLVNPVASDAVMTSDYGYRSIGCFASKYHDALDLSTGRRGSPIKAADGGTVQFVSQGYTGGLGKTVVINHGNGRKTRYSHLSSVDVRQGQQVSQGQQIGGEGNTGSSSGIHLDFALHKNDNSQAGTLPFPRTTVDPQKSLDMY